MFQLHIKEKEFFDGEQFFTIKEQTINLEHSLLSLSKWESRWKKAFLGKDERTREESLDYIRCMTITKNVDPLVYYAITPEQMNEIGAYIEDPMTATTFGPDNSPPNREIITSELIYYWMVSLQIPLECEKWHLNRLLTLIRVCNIKNQPPKKMSKAEAARKRTSMNAARRAKNHSKG